MDGCAGWAAAATLQASDGSSDAAFGSLVCVDAADSTYALVTAPGANRAYVFSLAASVEEWVQVSE